MNAALLPTEIPCASLTVWTVRLGAPEQMVVPSSSLYTFVEAPPGLPDSRRFALISDAAYAPLQWLQSLDEWEICLPVLPVEVVELDGYAVDVAAAIGDGETLNHARILLVTHLGESSFSVNLLAPIVLDTRGATGQQLILEGRPRYAGAVSNGAGYALRQQIVWDPSSGTFRPPC